MSDTVWVRMEANHHRPSSFSVRADDAPAVPARALFDERAVADAARRFSTPADTGDLLSWVVETFGDRWVLASTWQHAVIIDHLARITDRVPVCELDTGLLFPSTHDTRQRIMERYALDVVSVRPAQTVPQQADAHGVELWRSDPDLCCDLRKVQPLRAELSRYDAWVTGLRREQVATRRSAATVELDERHRMVKVNPLAHWTRDELWRYIDEHDVPYNPMLRNGFPSIGCAPCTHAVREGADERSGRWAGTNKIECGLHGGDTPAAVEETDAPAV